MSNNTNYPAGQQPAVPSAATSSSASSTAASRTPKTGLYSFSVHQPYTNWPLHHASATNAYSSWYAMHPPHQTYAPPAPVVPARTFREDGVQTGEDDSERADPKRRYWDAAVAAFLRRAGLYRALEGFREDVLMLSEEWERGRVWCALDALVQDISDIKSDSEKEEYLGRELDERKVDYVQSVGGGDVQTPAKNIKAISTFLRRSQKRNNASNREEWLLSKAEKRQRLNELGIAEYTPRVEEETNAMQLDGSTSKETAIEQQLEQTSLVDIPSCARTDAKPLNRETQMKYDIAKNEDGPLRRTMKGTGHQNEENSFNKGKQKATLGFYTDGVTKEKHPGVSSRLGDIETHLAVRYVPSPPQSLLDRIKFLEDHIIKLERENPPWAALHFNQPNRGWPPPPRLTPIIVPPHLISSQIGVGAAGWADSNNAGQPHSSNHSKAKTGQSSLHRAVMEKLEIQKAIGDLAAGASA